MLNNLVSLFSKSFVSPAVSQVKNKEVSYNPFSDNSQNNNPFLSTSFGTAQFYGKNQPVSGGYFAGYYNGKPNIVGRKLFIEV